VGSLTVEVKHGFSSDETQAFECKLERYSLLKKQYDR